MVSIHDIKNFVNKYGTTLKNVKFYRENNIYMYVQNDKLFGHDGFMQHYDLNNALDRKIFQEEFKIEVEQIRKKVEFETQLEDILK